MSATTSIPKSISATASVANENLSPMVRVGRSSLDGSTPEPRAWRRFLARLLCWWPNE
jgi:hypothetical protein